MCGRFTLTDEVIQLQAYFEFDLRSSNEHNPRFNISPGQNILAVVSDGNRRIGGEMKWGLVPSWAKDEKIGYKLINARAETIESKPSFKQAFERRRCLILADGYYEWKKHDKGKQPYRFIMKDHRPFAFAGLWESWTSDKGRLVTTTVITTEANEITRDVHDRMPVILPPHTYDTWLDRNFNSVDGLKDLLQPYPSEEMERYPVSTLVNSAKNDSVDLITSLNSL